MWEKFQNCKISSLEGKKLKTQYESSFKETSVTFRTQRNENIRFCMPLEVVVMEKHGLENVPTKIQQCYPETKVIWILLDFSSGDAFHSSIDKYHNDRDLDEAAAQVSLGFRVAARFLFKKNASSALGELKTHGFAVGDWFRLEFGRVVTFSVKTNSDPTNSGKSWIDTK